MVFYIVADVGTSIQQALYNLCFVRLIKSRMKHVPEGTAVNT
jgi:hypothetical protein